MSSLFSFGPDIPSNLFINKFPSFLRQTKFHQLHGGKNFSWEANSRSADQ
jgi:hypothetical protein